MEIKVQKVLQYLCRFVVDPYLCFPKQKQFYIADKHPQKKIDNHVVDSCQPTC